LSVDASIFGIKVDDIEDEVAVHSHKAAQQDETHPDQ
jgi:hypothetical protein